MITIKDVSQETNLLANLLLLVLDNKTKDGLHKPMREDTVLKKLELTDGNDQFETALKELHKLGLVLIKINPQNETRSIRRLSPEEKKQIAAERKQLAAHKKALKELEEKYSDIEDLNMTMIPSAIGMIVNLKTKNNELKMRKDLPINMIDKAVEIFIDFEKTISSLS